MRNAETGQFVAQHGLYAHAFYAIWRQMIGRCENPAHHAYADYGGRGISVCHEWHDPHVFIDWLESQNYGSGLQLDRRNNDSGYSPENCRVITPCENSRNRRDNVRYLVHGEMLLACEVEEKYQIKQATFTARVSRYGMTPEDALLNNRKLPVYEYKIDGVLMTPKQISRKFGILANTFNSRVNRGWNAERAALTPVSGCNH